MERFKGEVLRTAGRVWSGTWTWIEVVTGGSGAPKTVRVSGDIAELQIGIRAEFFGEWEDHEKYGRGFKATHYIVDPEDAGGVEQWIALMLPQVGPVRARDMVLRFGSEIWNVIENDPLQLTVVEGITEARAYEIQSAYVVTKQDKEVFIGLLGLGLSGKEAVSAVSLLRIHSIGVADVESDPYLLYFLEIASFHRVDGIAAGLGSFDALGVSRARAAIHHYLQNEVGREGHTAVREKRLVERVRDFLELGYEVDDVIERALFKSFSNDDIRIYKDLVMARGLDVAESNVALAVAHRLMQPEEVT